MTDDPAAAPEIIDRAGLNALVDALHADGYRVIGPKAVSGAIVYEPLANGDDLPAGWIDEQEGGYYRLTRGPSAAVFAHTVGPQGWKRFLFPPRQTLWEGKRTRSSFTIEQPEIDAPPTVLLGVRACELAAIAIQDRVFLEGSYVDRGYAARRAAIFIVAVNCGRSTATCFCASMHTGPRVGAGYDLALTELCDENRHDFIVEAGSERGAAVLARLARRPAQSADLAAGAAAVELAAATQRRAMRPDAEAVLKANLEHSRWNEVASRCLSCTNCTLVCPTCFCSTVQDVTDLSGDAIARERRWDSCFTLEFSYIHGGSVRREGASRYRQWLTHKLAHWHDQFGSSGCTGCGRCIAWCPVGIDITEEVAAVAQPSAAIKTAAGDHP